MYCKKCGHELVEDAVVCPNCGCAVDNSPAVVKEKNPIGWGILSFLIPLVGWILAGVWWKKHPKVAKVCLICGIVGFVVNFFINLQNPPVQ